MILRGKWLAVALAGLLGAMTACGSSSKGTDAGVDVQGEVAEEAGADALETAPEQVEPVAEVAVEEVAAAEAGETIEEVALVDADWDSLPRLPADKTFTTRYAAGVARRDATPKKLGMPMGGFGMCGGKLELCRLSEGYHDPQSVTAVALADTQNGEVVIFALLDSVGLMRVDIDVMHILVQNALYTELGVYFQGERFMMSASHAHSTVDTAGIWGPLPKTGRDPEYIQQLREAAAEAAVAAYKDLQDVDLDWGQGTAPNHDDDRFQDDLDLFVLRGRKHSTQEALFTFTRWSGHPTSYGASNRSLSADFLGTFRYFMEAEAGGTALFMNGSVGSVYCSLPDTCEDAQGNPLSDVFTEGWQDPDEDPGRYVKTTCWGRTLANAALVALDNAQPLGDGGIRFRDSLFQFHPDNKVMIGLAKIGAVPVEPVDVMDPEAMFTSRFSWATVGDLDYISVPGEAFPDFTFHVKEKLLAAGKTHPVVLGLTQDWMGYLLSSRQYWDGNVAKGGAPEPDLAYHRSLCISEQVEPSYLKALDALIEAE